MTEENKQQQELKIMRVDEGLGKRTWYMKKEDGNNSPWLPIEERCHDEQSTNTSD